MQLSGNDLKRLKRQLSRLYLGLNGFQPEDYEFVTLTTPEDFPHEALNDCFRRFKLRMQRAGMWGAYYAVREWNSRGTTEHIHILLKVQGLDYRKAGKHWTDCVNYVNKVKRKAVWWKAVRCYSKDGTCQGLARYISKYLAKQGCEDKHSEAYLKRKGRSMWYSQDWIYPKWKIFKKLMWRIRNEVDDLEKKFFFKKLGKRAFIEGLCCEVVAKSDLFKRLGWSITLLRELAQFGDKEYFRGLLNARIRL